MGRKADYTTINSEAVRSSLLKRSCIGSLFLLAALWIPKAAHATSYSFVTRWEVPAPLPDVWRIISDAQRWPEWWKGVEVELVSDGDATGVRAQFAFVWKATLPYKLRFLLTTADIIPHESITGFATGELEGTGVWLFCAIDPDTTVVEYHWRVRTTRAWMNQLAFVLKPLFKANHNVVMRRGERGLLKELGY